MKCTHAKLSETGPFYPVHFPLNVAWNLWKTLKSFLQSYNKSLMNQTCSGPYWENIGPRSFLYGPRCARSVLSRPRANILPLRPSRLVNKIYILTEQAWWPGVNKGLMIWPSSTFFLRDTGSSSKHARKLYLACSGSQSQLTTRFILPAHGASHIIREHASFFLVQWVILNTKQAKGHSRAAARHPSAAHAVSRYPLNMSSNQRMF